MAKLSAGERNALPDSDFAGPGRTFPVNDANHARAAIMDGAKGETLVKAKAALHKFNGPGHNHHQSGGNDNPGLM